VSLVLLAYLATPVTVLSQNASASSSSETSISHNGKSVYRWNTSSTTADFNVELRGKIELTDDDKDIKSISDDGYLEIAKTVFGSKRSIRIESLGAGKMSREYYEGRTKMPWDPNGKKWLGEILPELVHTTTIGAEARVKRIFAKGGTNAVLSEIDKLENDHVRAHYGKLLMQQAVAPKDYAVVINKMSDVIDSDHYITDFLQSNVKKFLTNKEATTGLFAAAGDLESDHYKTIVITEALKGSLQTPENLRLAMKAASEMESDHYVAQVLSTLLQQDNIGDDALTELINTTKTLESDHYKTMVLTQALEKKGLPPSAHERLLESVKEMSSDHYITQVIVELMVNKLSDKAMTDLLEIIPAVESDHYRTEIFNKLLEHQDLTPDQFAKVLAAAGNMDSDHYKSEVLKRALTGARSNAVLISILNSVDKMESDHYITDVLITAAPKVKNAGADVKNAYSRAAKKISSDTYYGQAMKAVAD